MAQISKKETWSKGLITHRSNTITFKNIKKFQASKTCPINQQWNWRMPEQIQVLITKLSEDVLGWTFSLLLVVKLSED